MWVFAVLIIDTFACSSSCCGVDDFCGDFEGIVDTLNADSPNDDVNAGVDSSSQK